MLRRFLLLLAVGASLLLPNCGGGGGGGGGNPGTGSQKPEFSVGGTVSGLTGNLTLQNNSTDNLLISADGSFSFATKLLDGSSYAVSVLSQPEGQSCNVVNGTGTVSGANIAIIAVVCEKILPSMEMVNPLTSNGYSGYSAVSSDGRFVAFMSVANNLVPNDTNGFTDIFLYDRNTGQTRLVSKATDGTQGNGHSDFPVLSNDGRYIAFISDASNFYPGDTNNQKDVFVHDVVTGTTTLISKSSSGIVGNGWSVYPSISSNGRFVAFDSVASNLVSADDNNIRDVFVYDSESGTITRISVRSGGVQSTSDSWIPSISADGSKIVFSGNDSGLVPNDVNGQPDIFLHDRLTGETTLISTTSSGGQGNGSSSGPRISQDGTHVVFGSSASNLIDGDTNGRPDIFVKNLATGQLQRVSLSSDGAEGTGYSFNPSISADGRFVAFSSNSPNLVDGDTNGQYDIFLHDLEDSSSIRVSSALEGTEGNADCDDPELSGDGHTVVFTSNSSNLVSGDTNGVGDVYAYERP